MKLCFSYIIFIFINYIHAQYPTIIQKKILHSPIVNFLPQLKLHHIIVLSKPNIKNIYTVDFSPLYSSPLKLLLGKTVSAEIRVRNIDLVFDTNDDTIINYFFTNNCRLCFFIECILN